MRNIYALLAIAAVLVANAYAETRSSNENDLPALACRYETTHENTSVSGANPQEKLTSSYLWREATRVETRDAGGKTGAVWERGSNGEIFYRKLYHQARKAIEYYPDDLRAAGHYPRWQAVASIFDPELLGSKLKQLGQEVYMGRNAERYRGEMDGVTIEVLWLTQERLPALVKKATANRSDMLRLAEIWPLELAPWASSTRVELDQYEHLDFADLGDKESDPFVKWAVGESQVHQH